jgi:hypothetical protein|tara:strand:+ start:1056 stop:1973 length:918 start_codon:yes stop_codon:yes gene_type:complete
MPDPTRNTGPINLTGGSQIPQTLADALAAMGMSDYSYMFSGKGSDIGSKLGLTGEQSKKFAQYLTPFQGGQFGDLLSSIPDWRKEQMGMLGEQRQIGTTATLSDYLTGLGTAESQYGIGTGAAEQRFGLGTSKARESYGTNVEGLRAKALQDMLSTGGVGGTFAGSGARQQAKQTASDVLGTQYGGMQAGLQSTLAGLGAEKETSLASLLEKYGTTKEQLESTKKESLDKLGLSYRAGEAQIGEEQDQRLGQAYGLLSDYINRVLGLGSQWAGFDPGGVGIGGGKGLGGGKVPIGGPGGKELPIS